MRPRLARSIAAALVAVWGGFVSADLIRLRNGGELRGTLHPGHTRDPQVSVDTLSGGLVVVARDQIAFTTVRRLEVEEYEVRSRRTPHTVEAHWELAEWCRQNRLSAQRDEQLELLLTVDPAHAAAHKALGHVQEHGEWMTREEQMASRGYYLHRGKWVTQQELELLDKSDAERAAEQEWFSKVYAWTRWLTGSNERQRQEGAAALQKITDPAAVAALTQHLGQHDQAAVRQLFVDVLADIPGPRPVRPLVDRSLFDPSVSIRETAFKALKPDQREAAVAAYTPALRSSDNAVINRAGLSLGRLGDPRSVPALIDALVTRHSYQIRVPVNNLPGVTQGPNGTMFADPRVISQYLPPEVDLALRAGQLPFGVQINAPTMGQPRFRDVKMQVDQQNASVLTALEDLTGQHFGYDERTWRLWWAAEGAKLLSKS